MAKPRLVTLRPARTGILPVVDAVGRPVGLLDITDLIGLFPTEEVETETAAA